MNEIELKKIWNKLQGKLDVGNFEVFKSKMSDTDSRKRFYDKYHDKLSDKGVELGDYKTYENTLSNKPTSSLPSWVPDCLKNKFVNLKSTNSPTQVYMVYKEPVQPDVFGVVWYFDEPKNGINKFTSIRKSNEDNSLLNTNGVWECQSDGNVLIKTEDGKQYSTKNKKWVEQLTTSSQTTQRRRGTPLTDNEYEGVEFKFKNPGDKNYIYGFKEGDWYAKNINNKKVFNITQDGYQKSVDILNTQFPKEKRAATTFSKTLQDIIKKNELVKKGYEEPVVKVIKQKLKDKMQTEFDNSGIDVNSEEYDQKTEDLVKTYQQKNNNLKVDGIVGPETAKSLLESNNNESSYKSKKMIKEQNDEKQEKAILSTVIQSHKNCLPNWLKNPKLTTHDNKNVIMGNNANNEEVILYVDLKDGQKFKSKNLKTNQTGTWSCKPLEDITTNDASLYRRKVNLPKENCETALLNYLASAIEHRAGTQTSIAPNFRQMRSDVEKCASGGIYDKFEGFTSEDLGLSVTKKLQPFGFLKGGKVLSWREIKKILTGRNKLLGPNPRKSRPSSPYLISQNVFESTNDNLGKLINESLNEMVKKQKKENIQESKIVKNRFKVLVEGKNKFNKEETNKFFIDVINEITYMNSLGMTKEVIKEELINLLSTLLKSDNMSVMGVFKENFAKWLSDKVVDMDSEVVMSDAIRSAIMNVDDNQVVNLIDCDFTSEILTKTVISDWKNKLLVTGDNPRYVSEILRKTLRDTIDNSTFFNTLKDRIEQMICPLLNNIEKKMEKAEVEIKNKIVRD